MSVEDRILLRQLQKGNKSVFEELYYEYYQALISLAEGYVFNSQVCEDIVHGVFIYLWENASDLVIHTSIKAYLYQTVRNKCNNHLRDLEISDRSNILYLESMVTGIGFEDIEEESLFQQLKRAICQLPPEMAKVFRMKYLDNMKNREISEHLNISENTVKTQLKRATSKLRIKFNNSVNGLFLF
ncbi:RNA polymerase sigma-70 factor [Puteibacter caeruleilacunae]|nr:RNA polymerase sigma-70 factor [Puteibacter caeruleilacunae]